jgi:hypothetical protein
MTELTPRQILDAIRESLDETARRFATDVPAQTPRRRQAGELTNAVTEISLEADTEP